jgi:hypothetical protein
MAKGKRRQRRNKPAAEAPSVLDGRVRFRLASPTSATGRKLLKQLFEDYRRRFEGGDNVALLLAAETVLRSFTPPYASWVQAAFHARLEDFLLYRAATLGDAFSVKRASKHVDRQREIEQWRGSIIQRIAELERAGMLRGKAFETVAETLTIMLGKTVSKDWVEKSVFRDKASRPWRGLYGVDTRPKRKSRTS